MAERPVPDREPGRMTERAWRNFQYEWMQWVERKQEACR